MRTLFIERTYLHGQGGGTNCARAYINAFAELSDEMSLVYPTKPGKEADDLSRRISTLYPNVNNFSIIEKGLRAMFGQLNFLHNLPQELFKPGKFDIVVFSGTQASQGLVDKFKRLGVKIVTLHHNYEYEFVRDNATPLFKPSTIIAVKHAERKAVTGSDLNLCLTPEDIELFRTHYSTSANYALVGAFEYQKSEDKPVRQSSDISKTFIITGDLSYRQSNNSLIPWIETYYPILKAEVDADLIIAGRNPSDELSNICQENGIELIASPDNMDSVLVRGDYYICPVSLGGGLKFRCMDGLKWGMPVLAHKVSARGYNDMIDVGVFKSYNSPDTFRQSLSELLATKVSKSEVINHYKSHFSFEEGIERLREALQSTGLL